MQLLSSCRFRFDIVAVLEVGVEVTEAFVVLLGAAEMVPETTVVIMRW